MDKEYKKKLCEEICASSKKFNLTEDGEIAITKGEAVMYATPVSLEYISISTDDVGPCEVPCTFTGNNVQHDSMVYVMKILQVIGVGIVK